MTANNFTMSYIKIILTFEIASYCVPSEATGSSFTFCHQNMIQNRYIAPAVKPKKLVSKFQRKVALRNHTAQLSSYNSFK